MFYIQAISRKDDSNTKSQVFERGGVKHKTSSTQC